MIIKDLKEGIAKIMQQVKLVTEFRNELPAIMKEMDKAKKAINPVAVQAQALESAINRLDVSKLSRVIETLEAYNNLRQHDRDVVREIVKQELK